jgi:hypothetical protein
MSGVFSGNGALRARGRVGGYSILFVPILVRLRERCYFFGRNLPVCSVLCRIFDYQTGNPIKINIFVRNYRGIYTI